MQDNVPLLPAPVEPLIGREAELAALELALGEGEGRLLTLTGPAGVGKTAVALGLARGRVAASAGDVVVWVPVDGGGVAGLCDAVSAALGLGGSHRDGDAVGRVGRALRERGEVLLVLDGLDAHVGCAHEVFGPWLALAPEARWLVTSRERLRVDGESVVELGPLALPGAEGSAAVELFVRCARRVRPDFTLDAAEAPFVGELVRQLDGLPLAIKLAAARMAVMSPRALLHRLGNRFAVLRTGGARPASLEAAIDASWAALAAPERDALAQCTVFRGGFSVEAAEAVVDLCAHPGAPPTLDVLQALREKSLLTAVHPASPGGELRLGLLTSVREFASRHLDARARSEAERRHAACLIAQAEAFSGQRPGAPLARWLRLERANLLAIIERVIDQGPVTARQAEPALRALCALGPLLLLRGPLEGYLGLLEPALRATRNSGVGPALVARALWVRGLLLSRCGRPADAARDLLQSLSMARTLDDRSLEARALHPLALLLAEQSGAPAALSELERARALFDALAERGQAASVLASQAALLARDGRPREALPLLERAAAVHRADDDALAEARALRLLGRALLDLGLHAQARSRFEASAALCLGADDPRGAALADGELALVQLDERDAEGAAERLGRAASSLRSLGFRRHEGVLVGYQAIARRTQGHQAEAYALLGSALPLLDGDPRSALLLAHRAGLEADAGRATEAAALLDRAAALLPADGWPSLRAVVRIERARIERAPTPSPPGSLHERLALGCQRQPSPPPPSEGALVIGPSAGWFRPPHGERIGLERRKPLALLLARLASERLDRPGKPLPWEALLEAAWPGERVLASAGVQRVRVAVSTLRKLGLREALLTDELGYLLSPRIETIVL